MNSYSVTDNGVFLEIETDKGTFHFGVDNDGMPYIGTGARPLIIHPQASNKIRIEEDRR